MIRHNRENPCPVCGGHDGLPRGKAVRCSGFTSDDGKYAHCSREEQAGGLPANGAGLFAHFLAGSCRCGVPHGDMKIKSRVPVRPTARVIRETLHKLVDAAGVLVAEHIRRDLDDGAKRFSWRVPGEDREGLHGLRKEALPLYGLPRMVAGAVSTPVVLVEGEKKADVLQELAGDRVQVVATATGAAGTPSDDAFRPLAGRPVLLWPDHDEEGELHMGRIASILQRLGVAPKRITWKAAREKGDDAADFVNRGGTVTELDELVTTAQLWAEPKEHDTDELDAPVVLLTRLSDISPEPVRWLWPGRIPLGKLTILDGDPGLGKTLIALDLAARVSRGREMPDGTRGDIQGPAGVIIMSAEDDAADTIRPRLDAAEGDPAKIMIFGAVLENVSDGTNKDGSPRDRKRERLPTLADVRALRQAVTNAGARLVIVDPFMAYLAGKDACGDSDIRSLLAPVVKMAAETNVAVLVIRHLNKSGGGNPLYRGGGSIGILAAARAGLLVAPDPDDESGQRRVLAITKANLSEKPCSLAYRIDPAACTAHIAWLGASAHDAGTLLQSPLDGDGRSGSSDAANFLRDALAVGPRPVRDVQREAKAAGIGDRTLDRAKARLGVKSRKSDFSGAWTWELTQERHEGPSLSNGTLGALGVNAPESTNETKIPKDAARDEVCPFPGHFRWRDKTGGIKCEVCQPPLSESLVVEHLNGASS